MLRNVNGIEHNMIQPKKVDTYPNNNPLLNYC
jgi:hypothetical protein